MHETIFDLSPDKNCNRILFSSSSDEIYYRPKRMSIRLEINLGIPLLLYAKKFMW